MRAILPPERVWRPCAPAMGSCATRASSTWEKILRCLLAGSTSGAFGEFSACRRMRPAGSSRKRAEASRSARVWPGRSTPLSVRKLRRAVSRHDSLSPDRAALSAGKGAHAPGPWCRAIVHGTAFAMGARSELGFGHPTCIVGRGSCGDRRQAERGAARVGAEPCSAQRGLRGTVVPLSTATAGRRTIEG